MRVQPRLQILGIWGSLLGYCYRDRAWVWGGRDGSNAIGDAEQVLCLMYPMTEMDALAVADPDTIRQDVADALKPFGSVARIPRAVVEIAEQFFERYTSPLGEPMFNGGSYFHALNPEESPTQEQRESLDVVDSYARSVTFCLAILGFLRDRAPLETNATWTVRLDALHEAASRRLTAAMTGLLRSFVINSVSGTSEEGQQILLMLRRRGESDLDVLRRMREKFGKLRAQLRDSVQAGVAEAAKPGDDQLFECGWTWGIAEGAPAIDWVSMGVAAAPGIAVNRPCLCFTVSALDSIADLNTPRTRALNLLDEGQRRLADALRIRWELTQRYWSTAARFDPDHWPLEDIPWRTSSGDESDYFSLLVLSVVIHDLIGRDAADDAELLKAVRVLEELAERGRVTRRMTDSDPAAALHDPGVRIRLPGSEKQGPELAWYSYDYVPVLMKRCMQAARLAGGAAPRERLTAVAGAAMEHLARCRLTLGRDVIELWDGASTSSDGALDEPAVGRQPSWYFTERVVEALVATARSYDTDPPRSARLSDLLLRLLAEADHLFNKQLMAADVADRSGLRQRLDEIGTLIDRARALQYRRTGSAISLVNGALRLLEDLAYARDDAERGRLC